MTDGENPQQSFHEFKKLIDEQRQVKFKVTRCPLIIFERFQKYASEKSGNLYPAALESLLDAEQENRVKNSLLLDLEDIKQALGLLQAQIDELRDGGIKDKRTLNTFGSTE